MSVTTITLPSAYAAGSYSPVLDVTASNPANSITGEQQTVAANSGDDYLVVCPTYAPFFSDDLIVSITVNSVTTNLVLGTDYDLAIPFIGASRALSKSLHGGIVLLNNQLAGVVNLSYHTLGGTWVYAKSIDDAANYFAINDPYTTAMEQYADYQQTFPVIYSAWDKTDSSDVGDLSEAVVSMIDSIATNRLADHTTSLAAVSHIASKTNAHSTTAADIGLGSVSNYPPATDAQAADPTNNKTYISVAQLKIAFETSTPTATDTTDGIMALNKGNSSSDATDSTRGLTAAGFTRLASDVSNAMGAKLNTAQQEGTFSPWSTTWPKKWKGTSYATAAALKSALETYVKVTPLEMDTSTGMVWFPSDITIPDLTIT